MLTALVACLAVGLLLGLFFTVWVMIPAAAVTALTAVGLLWGVQTSFWAKVLWTSAFIMALELGYLAGAVLAHWGSKQSRRREADRPIRVALVEDEAIIAMNLERTLSESGHLVVSTATSGPEAIVAAKEHRPDVIVMDIRLAGGTDGVETAAKIRERFGIRSIFLTAHNDPQTQARARVVEPLGILTKPYRPEELQQALARVKAA